MCIIDGLYSNSSSHTHSKSHWVWLKEGALNFAIALIVGALSAAICYSLKGSDLDLFYKIGGFTALGMFLYINFLTVLKKEKSNAKIVEIENLEEIIQNEQPCTWPGKKEGEMLPNLFVGPPSKSIVYDHEIRLRVLRSDELFPTKSEITSKWDDKAKVIYYDVAFKPNPALFKLQARKLAEFVENARCLSKKVLFTGIYDANNQKINLAALQKDSPFVDVGIVVAHYLMQKTECTREEILSFLSRELSASYSEKTRVYNAQKGLTMSASIHINSFCPENAKDFEQEVDVSTIASKRYSENSEGFAQMKSDLEELVVLEDDATKKQILQKALDSLQGPFDCTKMRQAKNELRALP